MRAQGWCHAVVALAGIAMAGAASAQFGSIERLVMPGPVARAHADTETTCAACHVRFARGKQSALCLECHDDVRLDIEQANGFHGRAQNVGAAECAACHTEHEGRDADILGLDVRAFDHGLTNFPLLGKHADTPCVECHETNATYHSAETECNACHEADDRHMGRLGTACATCHAETSWADVRFDHAVAADFALTGGHATITCVSCHVGEQYADTPSTCVGCHREDDRHAGRNGAECKQCHTTRDWRQVLFDHFERTGFALRGGHDNLDCTACHKANVPEVATPSDCVGCHRQDDTHMGANGAQCNGCHRATEWQDVTFDHARDASFALNGAHAALACESCHVQPATVVALSTDCFSCHREDDPHAGQLGVACTTCHGEVAWQQGVRFDHDLSRFPLLGKHSETSCDSCHATKAFHDAAGDCVDCHAEDDAHERRLGADCAQCHNPNAWLAWTFDHDTRTDFALTGAHDGLACDACHRRPVDAAIELTQTCGSCHRGDDIHRGEFGANCAQCHTTESFRDLTEAL